MLCGRPGLRGGAGDRRFGAGRPSGYLRFPQHLRQPHKPVLCIPGNHDEPDTMRKNLDGAPFQMCGTYSAAGWHLVMLDSYDPGHVGGRLTHRRNWSGSTGRSAHRRRTPWCVCTIIPSRWAAAGWTPWGSPSPKPSGGSSTPIPTSAPWCGDMCTRRTMAGAATFGCSRPRPPARNSCRERPLCGRLAPARVPAVRLASRRAHRHRGPLGRIASMRSAATAAR